MISIAFTSDYPRYADAARRAEGVAATLADGRICLDSASNYRVVADRVMRDDMRPLLFMGSRSVLRANFA